MTSLNGDLGEQATNRGSFGASVLALDRSMLHPLGGRQHPVKQEREPRPGFTKLHGNVPCRGVDIGWWERKDAIGAEEPAASVDVLASLRPAGCQGDANPTADRRRLRYAQALRSAKSRAAVVLHIAGSPAGAKRRDARAGRSAHRDRSVHWASGRRQQFVSQAGTGLAAIPANGRSGTTGRELQNDRYTAFCRRRLTRNWTQDRSASSQQNGPAAGTCARE